MKCKFLILFVVAALTALLYPPLVSATSILGSAENFAVLAGTPDITNTGSTTITGDVGIAPALAITDNGHITLTGASAYHLGDATALQAKTDLTTAYTALNNMAPTGVALASQLGGVTLTSGVYAFVPGTVLLNGTLHLNAEGNNNAYWVFQIPSDLTTAVGSSVVVDNFGSNSGNDDGLFWVVGSSAGIFGSTSFQGNILALTSITLDNSATILHGRALARNGTVTMDTNTISFLCYNGGPGLSGGLKYDTAGNIVPIPEPATMLLFGTGIAGLASARMKRKKK